MSNIRGTTLHLLQDATGKTLDLKLEQELAPKPLTVIELKPETKETSLRDLTEGSVVDWGDGTSFKLTAYMLRDNGTIYHTYRYTSDTPRIVTIDGVIDRTGKRNDSPFDTDALTSVRSLGEVRGKTHGLFYRCDNLMAISEGLFANCSAVTSFAECFYGCLGLTAIPEWLFANCSGVTDFNNCFNGCTGLTAIPAGLFDHCTAVTDFSVCFAACTALTGESPYTMVDGKKIKLWERSPENGFAKVTKHEYCFYGCTGLSDYAEIPDDWK